MSNLMKVPFFTGVRRLFYAVTPNETQFKTTGEVPQYINEATPFFFMCIFLEIVVSLYRDDKKVRLNDGATSIIIPSIALASYVWIYERFCIFELPWDSAWTWWLCFLGVDMGYYWFHRFAHEVNFMWAAHQVHHSSEYYNFHHSSKTVCVTNIHIMDILFTNGFYIKTLGPLEYILNTPSHHRVHHGRNPYCIDKNYAGTLIIWDRLFESFEDLLVIIYMLNQFQFGFLKYMSGVFREIKGWKHKLAVIFFGPGWSPGKPRTGDIEDIPKVKAPHKQYHVQCPRWVNVYVAIHFLMVLLVFQEVGARKAGMTQTSVLCFLVYIGFSLSCFGRIFDQSSNSPYFEVMRLIITLLSDVVMCQVGFYGHPGYRPGFYIKTLGPLEYILNTPSHHRVHHGRNPYCIDKNYAGTLIIWDRLFEDEEVVYGLTHPINTFEPFEIQFGFLKYMSGVFREIKGWKHKLAVIFFGPGWSPGKPRTGDIEDIPKVKAPHKQYHVQCPRWVNVYVAIHFLMVLLVFQEVGARKAGMTQTSVLCFLVYIGFSLSCFGRIFDQSSNSPYFEVMRLIITLLSDVVMCQVGFYGHPGYRPGF
ncbi:hypothetical protein KUTeg_003916, partial [Tegillarca granosa]